MFNPLVLRSWTSSVGVLYGLPNGIVVAMSRIYKKTTRTFEHRWEAWRVLAMQRYEDLFILANFLKEKGSFGIPFLVIFIENGTPNSNLWVFFAVIQRIMYIFALYLPTPCHRKDGPQCLIDDGGHLAEVRIYGWYTTLCKSVIDALFWADRNLRNFF